jgi:hypothetical protein
MLGQNEESVDEYGDDGGGSFVHRTRPGGSASETLERNKQ